MRLVYILIHPTKLNLMNKEEQKNEYSMNRQILSQIIKTSESKIVICRTRVDLII